MREVREPGRCQAMVPQEFTDEGAVVSLSYRVCDEPSWGALCVLHKGVVDRLRRRHPDVWGSSDG